MPATVARLYRYPVKGLAAEPLPHTTVARGGGVPGDRRFAIARGSTAWNEARPAWLRKEAFVMLMRDGDEALATLRCSYERDGSVVVVQPGEGTARRADLSTADGRLELESIAGEVLGTRPDGPIRVVGAGTLSLTDIPQNGLSIINLASVEDFAARIGRPLDPLRFRANVYVDGLPAWAERDWIGRRIRLGEIDVAVSAHIQRCNATEVDPTTGARDVRTVRELRRLYGHFDLGVYAEVVTGGRLALGDPVIEAAGGAALPVPTGLRRAFFYVRNGWILLRSRLGL